MLKVKVRLIFILVLLKIYDCNALYYVTSTFDTCTKDSLPINWTWNKAGICKIISYKIKNNDTILPYGKKGKFIFITKSASVSPEIKTTLWMPKGNKVTSMSYSFYCKIAPSDTHKIISSVEFIGLKFNSGNIDTVYNFNQFLFIGSYNYDSTKLTTYNQDLSWIKVLDNSCDSLVIKVKYLNPSGDTHNFILFDNFKIGFDYMSVAIEEPTHPTPLTLYPNPAHSQIFINTNQELKNATLIITDITGKEVYRQANFNAAAPISTEALAKGFYLLSLCSEEGRWMGKFVKE